MMWVGRETGARDGAGMRWKGYAAQVGRCEEDGILTGRIAGIRDGVGFHARRWRSAVGVPGGGEDYLETCAKIGKAPQKH